MLKPRFALRTLAVLVPAAFAAGPALATDYTWVGGSGSWSDSAQWTPSGGPPGAADRATLNAGTATLTADTSLGNLVLGGGTIAGASFALGVGGASNWTAGSMTGAGGTSFAGSLAITGATDKNLGGGRVLNVVDTTWSGNTVANNNRIVFSLTFRTSPGAFPRNFRAACRAQESRGASASMSRSVSLSQSRSSFLTLR